MKLCNVLTKSSKYLLSIFSGGSGNLGGGLSVCAHYLLPSCLRSTLGVPNLNLHPIASDSTFIENDLPLIL